MMLSQDDELIALINRELHNGPTLIDICNERSRNFKKHKGIWPVCIFDRASLLENAYKETLKTRKELQLWKMFLSENMVSRKPSLIRHLVLATLVFWIVGPKDSTQNFFVTRPSLANSLQYASINLQMPLDFAWTQQRCFESLAKALGKMIVHPEQQNDPMGWYEELVNADCNKQPGFHHEMAYIGSTMQRNTSWTVEQSNVFGPVFMNAVDMAVRSVNHIDSQYKILTSFLDKHRRPVQAAGQKPEPRMAKGYDARRPTFKRMDVLVPPEARNGTKVGGKHHKAGEASTEIVQEPRYRYSPHTYVPVQTPAQHPRMTREAYTWMAMEAEQELSRQKRFLLAGVMALGGLLVGSMVSSMGTRNAIDKLNQNQQHMASQVRTVTDHVNRLEDTLGNWAHEVAKLGRSYLGLSDMVSVMNMQSQVMQLVQKISEESGYVKSLISTVVTHTNVHENIVQFLRAETLEDAIRQLHADTAKLGLSVSSDIVTPADLLQLNLHAYYDFDNIALNIIVSVPMYEKADLYSLYEFYPAPVKVEDPTTIDRPAKEDWFSMIDTPKRFLAKNDDHHMELSQEDLDSKCSVHNGQRFCSFANKFTMLHDTCMMQLKRGAKNLDKCPMVFRKEIVEAHQVSDTDWLLIDTTVEKALYACVKPGQQRDEKVVQMSEHSMVTPIEPNCKVITPRSVLDAYREIDSIRYLLHPESDIAYNYSFPDHLMSLSGLKPEDIVERLEVYASDLSDQSKRLDTVELDKVVAVKTSLTTFEWVVAVCLGILGLLLIGFMCYTGRCRNLFRPSEWRWPRGHDSGLASTCSKCVRNIPHAANECLDCLRRPRASNQDQDVEAGTSDDNGFFRQFDWDHTQYNNSVETDKFINNNTQRKASLIELNEIDTKPPQDSAVIDKLRKSVRFRRSPKDDRKSQEPTTSCPSTPIIKPRTYKRSSSLIDVRDDEGQARRVVVTERFVHPEDSRYSVEIVLRPDESYSSARQRAMKLLREKMVDDYMAVRMTPHFSVLPGNSRNYDTPRNWASGSSGDTTPPEDATLPALRQSSEVRQPVDHVKEAQTIQRSAPPPPTSVSGPPVYPDPRVEVNSPNPLDETLEADCKTSFNFT